MTGDIDSLIPWRIVLRVGEKCPLALGERMTARGVTRYFLRTPA